MKSYQHAIHGIAHALKTERNMRIHFSAVFYIIIAGLLVRLIPHEWGTIALACGLVIGAELINTALERLCDGLEPGHSLVVKTVKDLAAGAVFICAIAAVCVAVFIFWWPVTEWLVFWHIYDFIREPFVWAGVGALPFWIWYIFFLK